MEEQKIKKNNKRFIIWISIVILIIIGVVIYIFTHKECNGNVSNLNSNSQITAFGRSLSSPCQTIAEELSSKEYRIINSYDEYISLLKEIELSNSYNYGRYGTTNDIELNIKFNQNFFNDNNLIAVKASANNYVSINSCKEVENTAYISIEQNYYSTLAITNHMIFTPISKNINNAKIEYIETETKNSNSLEFSDKPIIYLYPEHEMKVNIKLSNFKNITCSYPEYKLEGWNVIAKPSGELIDLNTNRRLYSLYWEGINTVEPKMDSGFVIEGKDTAKFLEEKLAILGLTEREAEEFIIYWLPQLEKNKYNFIRFQSIEEINKNMPLEITPIPDTIIRVVMEWKPLEKYIEIPEQQLTTSSRNGFTIVEWGGTKIN